MENQLLQSQWFIITAIGGKEDSIADAIKEKVNNYGYESYVGQIRIFKKKDESIEIFAKDSDQIPQNLRKTKTISWEIMPDGKYKRTRIRITNKFPGYIFINMIYDRNVWFAIRNTPGVLGFVGSSGKGAVPIPITIEEYARVSGESDINSQNETANQSSSTPTSGVDAQNQPVETVTYSTDAKIGNNVDILEGSFTGMTGEVKKLDNSRGVATLIIDFFGRSQEVEILYNQFKISL
ncbi:MAG: transcription termination/antitermination protein NusG [Mycoplasmataceae bacterium]|nr:transcription termination/antitermination protein NusG [Mycoplasmataceae bacterium]